MEKVISPGKQQGWNTYINPSIYTSISLLQNPIPSSLRVSYPIYISILYIDCTVSTQQIELAKIPPLFGNVDVL